jgi:hypothetical protein
MHVQPLQHHHKSGCHRRPVSGHEPLRRQPAAHAGRVSRLSRPGRAQRGQRARADNDALGHATATTCWRMVCNIAAGRGRRTNLTPSSPSAPRTASRGRWTTTGERWRDVRSAVLTLETGWCNGLAPDWLQYSKGRYDAAQREHAGRGMWARSYVEPWLDRACIRANGPPGGLFGRRECASLKLITLRKAQNT